ncbi:MAG: hypothetical protein IT462_11355 [Planctomycetes bacterium]|nr:hypothetical protein [Planctomycetota bacterium]
MNDKVPPNLRWPLELLERATDTLLDNRNATLLAIVGRGVVVKNKEARATIMNSLKVGDDSFRDRAQKRTDMWLKEEKQFEAHLFGHSAITLWSVLETYVGDFIVQWIRMKPDVLQNDHARKLKISLADYIAMTADERLEAIVEDIFETDAVKRQRGIDKLEVALTFVRLGGDLDKEMKSTLWLLHQVRNIWAHNSGIADKKFAKDVGSMFKCEVGEVVCFGQADWVRATKAILDYILTIVKRIAGHFEITPEMLNAARASDPGTTGN